MMKSSHIRRKPSSMRLSPSCLWRKPSTTRPASQQPSRLAVAMAVACAAVLAGCSSMAPSYQRPESPVPDTFRDGAAAADAVRGSQVAGHGQRMQDRHHGGWADGMVASPQAGKGADPAHRTGAASAASSEAGTGADAASGGQDAAGATAGDTMGAMPDWQQLFVDERLRQVIVLALNNNRDLRVAMLNIEKARAEYRIQRASLFPAVTATGSHTAQRSSTVGGMAGMSGSTGSTTGAQAGGTGAASGGLSGDSRTSRTASLDVGITSWELDLFGRVRSLKDQALESWLSMNETQRSTRLSLVAEVATDWLTVAAYQQRLALAQETLASQQQTLLLTQRKHALGVVSGVDLASVQGSVESARVDVANYGSELGQAINALELVVGSRVPDALLPEPGAHVDASAVALAPLPANLSSKVLLERPDVLAAEHTLKAANANIGAARAAFFPTISLTATTGRSSDSLSSLFDGGRGTWTFMPSISVPIFNAGSLKGSLDSAKIASAIEVANYEKAIQTAFSEVANALAVRARVQEQLDAQKAYVNTMTRAHRLAEARYRHGVQSYLEALDAQRTLYSAQQSLITLLLQEASNRVTLYKVLGGDAQAQAGAAASGTALR